MLRAKKPVTSCEACVLSQSALESEVSVHVICIDVWYEGKSENIRIFMLLYFDVQRPIHVIHEQNPYFFAYKSVSISMKSIYTRKFDHLKKIGVRATKDSKLAE